MCKFLQTLPCAGSSFTVKTSIYRNIFFFLQETYIFFPNKHCRSVKRTLFPERNTSRPPQPALPDPSHATLPAAEPGAQQPHPARGRGRGAAPLRRRRGPCGRWRQSCGRGGRCGCVLRSPTPVPWAGLRLGGRGGGDGPEEEEEAEAAADSGQMGS